ncbi:MAG: ATP-binding cassette domain-containing protein [Burkholderiaceae bacterium]
MLLPARMRPAAWTQAEFLGTALLESFAQARQRMARSLWLSTPIGLMALLPSIFSLEVFDRVIYRQGFSTLFALLAGVAVALVFEWYLRRLRSASFREAGALMDWGLSSTLLDRMLGQPLKSLEDRTAAAWMSLFRDAGTVRTLVTGPLMQSVFDLPLAAFAIAIVGIVAWPVLPVVIVILVVFSVLAWWWADEVKQGKVEELQQARNLDMFTTEMCRARESVKALAQQAAVKRQWLDGYQNWLSESYARGTHLEDARELSHSLLVLSSIAITATGAYAVVNQWMSVGGLIAANMLAIKAISPVATLAGAWRQLAQSVEASRRLEQVFRSPVEGSGSALALPRPRGRLTLDEVSFRYDSDTEPVLDKVSIELAPAQLYVVVGKNGAGKSTLLKLLAGLYRPDEGRILIDEYDLQQFSREETADWIATLSQNVYFLDGSIADQLKRVAPDASDDQIVKACKLTGAHASISRLPKGYSTEMREGGRVLSAGVRRKIALAQVLLRNPAVLILDEPTNDLDHLSELQLIASLRLVARTRTVVVVTHSPEMVAGADAALTIHGDGTVKLVTAAKALAEFFAGYRPRLGARPPGERSPAPSLIPVDAGETAGETAGEAA